MSNFEKRNKDILKLRREDGWTYQKIADTYGITKERVRQIYIRELKREQIRQEEKDVTYEPSFYVACIEACKKLKIDEKQATRAYHCLNRAGIVNKLKAGEHKLEGYSDDTLMLIRNFGPITLKVVRLADEIF